MTELTPAETLRAAASLMRERAGKATPGPWHMRFVAARRSLNLSETFDRHFVCSDTINVAQADQSDAEHVASMHPLVALAVADWLDATAADYAELSAAEQAFLAGDHGGDADPAITVARTYLGDPDA